MVQLIEYLKDAQKRNGFEEILLLGETRWHNYQESLKHGVRLGDDIVNGLQSLADEFKIMAPWKKMKSCVIVKKDEFMIS
ncbi:MAG: hypothetical protein IH852_05585 [Bacteroidetes bacterium]|nr:hypothetical protein [Bacteroidota bacterium]